MMVGFIDDHRGEYGVEPICGATAGLAAVTDRQVITASAMTPHDFAHQIFRELGIYSEATLEAWYDLFRTRDPERFLGLLDAAE